MENCNHSFHLRGFTNQEMLALLAQLLDLDPARYPVDDLEPAPPPSARSRPANPQKHRYELTPTGLRIAPFFTRTYARLLRPKLAEIMPASPPGHSPLRSAFDHLQAELDHCCEEHKLVA